MSNKEDQILSNYRSPVIDFVSVLCATSGILIDEYLKDVERRMPLMQSSFRLAAIIAAWFQQDNNSPYKSTGSPFGISNCFHLLTNSGEVCLGSECRPNLNRWMFHFIMHRKGLKNSTKIIPNIVLLNCFIHITLQWELVLFTSSQLF